MKIQHQQGPQADAIGAVLDAASAVFAEAGYGGARVDEIARRAGMNKAMLYYYVGGKDALYEAVLSRNFSLLGAAMDEALAGASDAEARLRLTIAAVLETLARIPDHPKLMLHEVAGAGQTLPKPVLRQMAGIFGRVRRVLEDGQREGSFRRVNPLLTHLTIVGGIVFMFASGELAAQFGAILGERLPPRPEGRELSDTLADLILPGILAGASGPNSRRMKGKPRLKGLNAVKKSQRGIKEVKQ